MIDVIDVIDVIEVIDVIDLALASSGNETALRQRRELEHFRHNIQTRGHLPEEQSDIHGIEC